LLAKELLKNATAETRVAVVSAPSVFIQLKNLLVCQPVWAMFIELITKKVSGEYDDPQIYLFEFDNRFSMFKEFVHYDFRSPLSLPGEYY
jgi:EEF1A lysine methyltransferase 1